MRHVADKHPKDNPDGAIHWERGTYYICGDRMRGTVLLINPAGIIEMTPEYARAFAQEILTHCDDVGSSHTSGGEPT